MSFQDTEPSVSFDVRFPEPPEFLFLTSGTLPATLASGLLRPEVEETSPRNLWSSIRFFVYEASSFLFWFGIGALLDSGRLRIAKTMGVYLGARGGFAVFLPFGNVAQIGWRIEVLSWLAFAGYAIFLVSRWGFVKTRSLLAPQ